MIGRAEKNWTELVQPLLAEIDLDFRQTADMTGYARMSDAVRNAMECVDRRLFIAPEHQAAALENHPLPIGNHQTISQPYIVALMTEALQLTQSSKVLEIGTGCGYQAAVLGELAGEVVSLERLSALQETAAQRLQRLGYENIRVIAGDGFQGYPQQAPYDGIIVTAAPTKVPTELTRQLAEGGRIIIPVGEVGHTQWLMRGLRRDGELHWKKLLPVSFVPMLQNLE